MDTHAMTRARVPLAPYFCTYSAGYLSRRRDCTMTTIPTTTDPKTGISYVAASSRSVVEEEFAKAALLLCGDKACASDEEAALSNDSLAIARCLLNHLNNCNRVGITTDERNNHPATRLYIDALENKCRYRGQGGAVAECVKLLNL